MLNMYSMSDVEQWISMKFFTFLDPPKIVSPPLPSISVAGESHNFTCRATGHPIPVISWNFDSV